MIDHRLYAPATLRNRDVILDVLRSVLPTTSVVLEVASGSGEHIVHFAQNLPGLTFQPSDPSLEALLSISAWVKAELDRLHQHGPHCLLERDRRIGEWRSRDPA
jgi:hypothetical protein